MTRNVSGGFKSAVYDSETGEAFPFLLTINHPDLPVPIRVTNNEVDLPSRGETYLGYPFQLTWTPDQKNRPPQAQVQIGNVETTIIDTLRTISGKPTVTVELVRGSDPDVVEAILPEFELAEVNYDSLVVSGNLTVEYFINEPWPQQTFTQASHPGLF